MLDEAIWSCSLPENWGGVQKIVFHKVGKFSAYVLIKDLKKLLIMHATVFGSMSLSTNLGEREGRSPDV
jgi:hypothetical protein